MCRALGDRNVRAVPKARQFVGARTSALEKKRQQPAYRSITSSASAGECRDARASYSSRDSSTGLDARAIGEQAGLWSGRSLDHRAPARERMRRRRRGETCTARPTAHARRTDHLRRLPLPASRRHRPMRLETVSETGRRVSTVHRRVRPSGSVLLEGPRARRPACQPFESSTAPGCRRYTRSTCSSRVVSSTTSGTSATVDGLAAEHRLGPVDTSRARCHFAGNGLPFDARQRPLLRLLTASKLSLELAATHTLAPAQPIVAAGGLDSGSLTLRLQVRRPGCVAVPIDAPTGIPRQAQHLRQHLVAIGVGGQTPGQ